MHYFPLIPRIRAIYKSQEIAPLMKWHAENRSEEGENSFMRGPQDGQAWRFTEQEWRFLQEDPRHIRLGLSMDGVNPFSQQRSVHSTWPITLVNYNLPPYFGINKGFIILSTIVPGMETHSLILYSIDKVCMKNIQVFFMDINLKCLIIGFLSWN
jgi:hypothetical protein